MTAINPPFRAEHIGSLLRPQELLHAREGFDAGKVSAQELAAAEDKAVKAVVEMQRSIGIRGVTDGEYRRHMFFDG